MKDQDLQNEVVLEGKWEDFDQFVAAEDWTNAVAVMDSVGENGWESDAIRMNHVLNQAKSLGYLEPYEHVIPMLTEDERIASDLPDLMKQGVQNDGWTRNGDDWIEPRGEAYDLLGRIG